MGIVKKQGLLLSILSYAGVVIGYISWGYLFPNFLRTEQVGLLKVIRDSSDMFAKITQLGVLNSTTKYFPYFRDETRKHNGFFLYILLIPFIGFLVFCLLFFIFKNEIISLYEQKSGLLVKYIIVILPMTLFILYYEVLANYLVSLYKAVFPGVINEIVLRVLVLADILLFVFEVIDFELFFIFFICSYGITVILLIIYLFRINQFLISLKVVIFQNPRFKEMFVFGFFTLLAGAAALAVKYVDTLMISQMIGLSATGIYGVAFLIGSVIEVPSRSISKIVYPLLAEAWKNERLDEVKELYHKTSINQMIIGCYLFLGIWVNVDSIFIFLREEYNMGKYVILFIALSKLADMSAGVNTQIIYTSKHYKFINITFAVLLVLIAGTNYLLIPFYGINGAAAATFLSLLLFNFSFFLFLLIKYKMQPFSKQHLAVIFISITILIIDYLTPEANNVFLSIFIKSTLVTLLYGPFIILFNISPDVNEMLKGWLKRLRN